MFNQEFESPFGTPTSISERDESPVLYSLQGALLDLSVVFVSATALFVPLVMTGFSESLLAWAQSYPQLQLTELFLYAIILTTGFSVASLRRWMQLTDVLERHELAEKRMEEQARRLRRSNEELERFAYVASHDLREPLRTVHSHLSLLERELGDDIPEDAQESLDFAREGAGRMDRMVKSLLAYARYEREDARSVPVDANKALEKAWANLQATAERAGVELESSRLPKVRADDEELTLVLQNLLHNAIKHGRRLGAAVRVGGETDGDRARIWVEDEGPGVPEGQRDRIFELFRQGSTEAKQHGAGIGLTLCKRVAERHGGSIWVEEASDSSVDESVQELAPRAGSRRGARFVIELPKA